MSKEANRYSDMYFHYKEHVSEIESLDFDAIVEKLKEDVRTLARNL